MSADRGGQIVTFYSYKGGTGRSMAVANVGWILASSGLRVLVIDWDLEAPGLHRYFQPFLIDQDLRASPGVIDLMWDYTAAVMDPSRADDDSLKEYRRISRYATSVDFSFPESGLLDLVPAGQQDSDYAERVAAFDWRAFYERHGGGALIDAIRDQAVMEYDYVLIDSRTGLADSAGICTVHLPDVLVICLTLSGQNLDGGLAVAQSALEQRVRPMRVMPVLMRVEDAETAKAEVGRDYVRRRFDPMLTWLTPGERGSYWGEAEVPYKPFYAYEEILAAVGDRAGQANTLLAALERVTSQITLGAVSALTPMAEDERRRLLASFERRLFVADEICVIAAREDGAWSEWISWVFGSQGYRVTTAEDRLRIGGDIATELAVLLANAAAVVVVVSPALANSADWRSVTEAIVRRDPAGAERLVIPVTVSSTPTDLLDTRLGVNLVGCSAEEAYDLLVGVTAGRQVPQVTDEEPNRIRPWYPGDEVTRLLLRVAADQCVIIGPGGGELGRGPTAGADSGLGLQIELGELDWARLTVGAAPDRLATNVDDRVARATRRVGRALGRRYVPGSVARVLRQLVSDAGASNRLVLVGIEATAELNDLPWESLILPGEQLPVALDSNVALYRHTYTPRTFPRKARGPLRVLISAASPELANAELLDYEAELAQIEDAVAPARRRGQIELRVLQEGTLAEIRTALAEEPEGFHILHLSCHAQPGELILENADGGPDVVSADRLLAEAVPPGVGLPMVVLSGCSTGLAGRQALYALGQMRAVQQVVAGERAQWTVAVPMVLDPVDQPVAEGEAPAEIVTASFAARLADAGIPQVLAMQAPVTDVYATRFGSAFYRHLTSDASPDPLLALAEARRALEQDRQARRGASVKTEPGEWATPALFSRGQRLPLFDPREPAAAISPPRELILAEGIVVRPAGEFVGRRRQLREARRSLAGSQAGLLIHGIAGAGKSALAAQVLISRGSEAGLVVSVTGLLTVERLLAEIGRRLRQITEQRASEDLSPVGAVLSRADVPWEDRWRLLAEQVLPVVPMTVLLDDFEANLETTRNGWGVRDPDLAALLSRWLVQSGQSRLLLTARYQFSLPRSADRLLKPLHLAPLTAGETRKLLTRLPGVDALDGIQKEAVHRAIGGNPGTLEFLDALLRDGSGRFYDTGIRMEDLLRARGVEDPEAWLSRPGRDLGMALAEAIALSTEDAILSYLLEVVSAVPLAQQLVIGAAVYRVPVGKVTLSLQLDEEGKPSPGTSAETPAPTGLPAALRIAEAAGLLVPVPAEDRAAAYLVHRWVARAVAERYPEATRECHRRAAAYWRQQIGETRPGDRQDVWLLLEAGYHYHAAGETDEAVEVTELALPQLRTWGAYGYAAAVCREALAWVPGDSPQAASLRYQLGALLQAQGDYNTAASLYRDALASLEAGSGTVGIGQVFLRLGTLMQARGDDRAAEEFYYRAREVFQSIGDRAGFDRSLLRLGTLVQARNDYDPAESRYREALASFEVTGDRSGISRALFHLGTVAQARGDGREAEDLYRRSLTVAEEFGDRSVLSAILYQLGLLAEQNNNYKQAVGYYYRSLIMCAEVGDRASEAQRASQLGILAAKAGFPDTGIPLNLRAFAIRQQIESQDIRIDAWRLYRQREMVGSVGSSRVDLQACKLEYSIVSPK